MRPDARGLFTPSSLKLEVLRDSGEVLLSIRYADYHRDEHESKNTQDLAGPLHPLFAHLYELLAAVEVVTPVLCIICI